MGGGVFLCSRMVSPCNATVSLVGPIQCTGVHRTVLFSGGQHFRNRSWGGRGDWYCESRR